MKILLIISLLLIGFNAKAQHAYISSSGAAILYTGSIESYLSPDIYVDAQYYTTRGVWIATISVGVAGISAAVGGFAKSYQIEFDNATIDALTPVGANTTQKTKNCVMQAVKNYLAPLNVGTTFTLN